MAGKGHPLSERERVHVLRLIEEQRFTRQQIADIVGISKQKVSQVVEQAACEFYRKYVKRGA